MRLTTWNCNHGSVDERLERLRTLKSELVVLQECREPAIEREGIVWRGELRNRGVAVATLNPELRLEPVAIDGLHPTVVPLIVHAPTPFLLLGVWTHPTYHSVALRAMAQCHTAAAGLPIVAAGDFNISPGIIGQERSAPKFLRQMREEFGMVSAYHHHLRVEPGAEAHPTLYRRHRSFHIDYMFLPEIWAEGVESVEVGSYSDEAWNSDHRPVTVHLQG